MHFLRNALQEMTATACLSLCGQWGRAGGASSCAGTRGCACASSMFAPTKLRPSVWISETTSSCSLGTLLTMLGSGSCYKFPGPQVGTRGKGYVSVPAANDLKKQFCLGLTRVANQKQHTAPGGRSMPSGPHYWPSTLLQREVGGQGPKGFRFGSSWSATARHSPRQQEEQILATQDLRRSRRRR